MTGAAAGRTVCDMATNFAKALFGFLPDLRIEPTAKRVSAVSGGQRLLQSDKALLVWEPGRIVPQYAVPECDLAAELVPSPGGEPGEPQWVSLPDGTRVLPPGPFAQHTTPGQPLTIRAGAVVLPGAAFRPADPDLEGYLILDFSAFEQWFDDDEPLVGHPRDPFKRIDVRPSSRSVRICLDEQVLADSTRPVRLYETHMAVRHYLSRADVRLDLMQPSATRSQCAYKGEASYWSYRGRDICWSYETPLVDVLPIAGLICFFDERVDTFLDGAAVPRPWTPWSD